MNTPELSPAVTEGIEAEAMFLLEAPTPEPAATQLGLATGRIGGGVVLSMRNDVTKYWSKALGFGFTEPVTADLIEEIIAFYRSNDDPFAVFQFAPSVLPTNWAEVAAAHGLQAGGHIHKHVNRIDAVQSGETSLRVGEIAAEQVREWSGLVLDVFGMPRDGLIEMMAATATVPAFRLFAAWDEDEMVATGLLYVQGSVGEMLAGATRPDYRRRGAQSALIGVGVKAAAAAGCEWIVAETGDSGSSLNNMRRAGLRTAYVRQNWIWEG